MLALIKLNNGTELIGSIKQELDTQLIIEDPLQINYRLVATQPMPTVSISRYMPFSAEKTIRFDKQQIMHMVQPKKEMADYYASALLNYQTVIDKNVEEELSNAARPDEEVEEESDAFKALMERLHFKGPLN